MRLTCVSVCVCTPACVGEAAPDGPAWRVTTRSPLLSASPVPTGSFSLTMCWPAPPSADPGEGLRCVHRPQARGARRPRGPAWVRIEIGRAHV